MKNCLEKCFNLNNVKQPKKVEDKAPLRNKQQNNTNKQATRQKKKNNTKNTKKKKNNKTIQ